MFEEVSPEDNGWSITGGRWIWTWYDRSGDGFDLPFVRNIHLAFEAGSGIGEISGLIQAKTYEEARNLTWNTQDWEWEYAFNITGTGAAAFELIHRSLAYTDKRIDVDGDERFNELDPVALQNLIGSTDPNHVAKWDFDASEDIGSEDVSLMQFLVDEHWDSGLLGDFDGNGDLDCDDLDGVDSHFGYHLGEANYVVELDADVDGETTEDDRHRVYHAILPGDVDADGAVEMDDLQALLAAIGLSEGDANYNPYADVDGDGNVDLADLQLLLSSYGDSCN